MTSEEARLFKRLIREAINVYGNCKILSQGDACKCALCQIDNMNPDDLRIKVEQLIEKGYNENHSVITPKKRDRRCKGCSWEDHDSGCNVEYNSITCALNRKNN